MLQEILSRLIRVEKAVATPAQAALFYATVTQRSPLRIRVDGDASALTYTPVTVTSLLFSVGDRVVCTSVSGQVVVIGGVDLASLLVDNGRYVRKVGGNPYTISNLPCAITSGLNWALAAIEVDMNGMIVTLPAQATVTMPTNTTRWYYLDYNVTTGATSLTYDAAFGLADTATHKYLPLCKVVSTTSITYLANVVSLPYGGTFPLGSTLTQVWYPTFAASTWYMIGSYISAGLPTSTQIIPARTMGANVRIDNKWIPNGYDVTMHQRLYNFPDGTIVHDTDSSSTQRASWWITQHSEHVFNVTAGTIYQFTPGLMTGGGQQFTTRTFIVGELVG